MRNLDISALRSLAAIADAGGVTRAADSLNLTQSAVSMQIKRLEQLLDATLLQKQGRGVVLTAAGEQLVSYARRLLELHDEAYSRLTFDDYEGTVSLGVPDDLVQPYIPRVLRRCREQLPRVEVHLVSSLTRLLLQQFEHGELDVMLTTDSGPRQQAETLLEARQHWLGGTAGQAYLKRPLPLGMCNICSAKPGVIAALDNAGIAWQMVGDTNSTTTVHAMVNADLAVTPVVEFLKPPGTERLRRGLLPDLPEQFINLSVARSGSALGQELAAIVRRVFQAGPATLALAG
ncbi:MAG: LysR family transcriptional regulator [Pseudomonadota bacterium]